MPAEQIVFQPSSALLTFEEITAFVMAIIPLGIDSLRLTGGEPLLRAELPVLVRMLALLDGIRDLALTTNGTLLVQHAASLKQAGLQRLNISLDAMEPDAFRQVARRPGLQLVLDGIEAAIQAGFTEIRINTVAIRGITERQLPKLVEFASRKRLVLRFIEFMPLDADQAWQREGLLSGAEIRALIENAFGPLEVAARENLSQPAIDYWSPALQSTIGFINPVSQPFCGDCNRLRLTAEGKLRNCLFSTVEWDMRELLRGGAYVAEIQNSVRACVAAKKPGHGIDDEQFIRPQRAMYQIGG
jgi:cyclic pyranopterin phosphate synthase